MSRNVFRPFLLSCFIISICLLASCIKKIDRPSKIDYSLYFPINIGDYRLYSGPLGKSVVTSQTNNIFTFTDFDSLGSQIGWKDFIRSESGVYLKNIISKSGHLPSVFFEPAFRFLPWSNITGDTLFQTAAEISLDSNNTHLLVMVEYEVVAVETITTPAGRFTDCIKIQMDYSAPDGALNNIYNGVTLWWFARDVGMIRYEALGGAGELLEAEIDGYSYP